MRQIRRVTMLPARPGKKSKGLRGRGSSGNIEGNFGSYDTDYIRRQSGDANGHWRRNICRHQLRGCGLMAQMAGGAIRAGFSAMIMPRGAADEREHEQKRGESCADLNGSNCAVLLHVCVAGKARP